MKPPIPLPRLLRALSLRQLTHQQSHGQTHLRTRSPCLLQSSPYTTSSSSSNGNGKGPSSPKTITVSATSSPSPKPPSPNKPKEKPTYPPLADQLKAAIKMAGPIPLAHYMRQCLTSDTGGYYTTPRRHHTNPTTTPPTSTNPDQFGTHGDFVTSPEISQVFGEMLAIWLVTEWIAQGSLAHGVVLCELGPGRGTLMDDILRTLQAFKGPATAIDAVYLVEASPELREKQRTLLCDSPSPAPPLEEFNGGWRAWSNKYGRPLQIVWYEDIRLMPKFETHQAPYFLAHEFFDSLPIHAFQATPDGWRELLVSHRDLDIPSASPPPPPTPSTATDDFHLVLSPNPTPYSQLLPTFSPRFANPPPPSPSPSSSPTTIEVSPDSLTHLTHLARHLSAAPLGGAILIIDYSTVPTVPPTTSPTTPLATTPSNTLRGIRAHGFVSPFAAPGDVDLSADVDFHLLAETALRAAPNVEVHGPVPQGWFLRMLGVEERVGMLAPRSGKGEAGKEVVEAVRRLVSEDEGGMGGVYKVMAIVPERGGRRPVGFGGDVVG